jgi:cell division protein FtsB
MKLFESLKKKKFLLLNIFFTLYIGINLIGGDRGLISYIDKKNTYKKLIEKDKSLTIELKNLDHKIALINKNDHDYLDMLYRQKLNFVTDDEIIIKLK